MKIRMKEIKTPFKLGMPLLVLLMLGLVGYQVVMNLASEKVVEEVSKQIPKEDIQALLTEPGIQQMIEDEVGADKKEEILTKYAVESSEDAPLVASKSNETVAVNITSKQKSGTTSSDGNTSTKGGSKLKFTSKDQVTTFLLSKFTMNELMSYANAVKGGVTPEKKAEIKATVMKRLTPEEYEALKLFAIIELSK
ncbi:hypothetical protein QFZ87_000931 [Bacillus sp. SLBN-46]|uniref:hypothetical protein n=1 Tax=Bacillus sp. SLBN-46 TaxID=3042283 RepID=UPI00286322D1|nr:hypothetical protein [Bacillus sp. SLBN-46]MDR6121334.1 hypothetical protein [Bacillus sp. SLBN-46]